jgi:VWFA-related protein
LRLAWRRRALPIAAVLLAASVSRVSGTDAPLSSVDVARFLRVGISERTILIELGSRGFAESLDAAAEEALRQAGASDALIEALRRAGGTPNIPSDSLGVVVEAPAATLPPAAAAAPLHLVPARGATFAADTRTVRVPVSVTDDAGQPVLGLRSQHFRISDGGERRRVTLFSSERRALRLALALDVSGSMQNKIRKVEAALRHFVGILEPADEILVITFSDRVRVVQDFTSDREQLSRVLDLLAPDGATALWDAADAAIRHVAPGPAESKAVVLVTDGVDTCSATSFEALRERARRAEVPVYSIGLDGVAPIRDLFRPRDGGRPRGGQPSIPGIGRRPRGGLLFPGGTRPPQGAFPGGGRTRPSRGGPGGSFDAGPLIELAEETGGHAQIVRGLGQPSGDANDRLRSAVETIALALRHRYLVGYEPPEGKRGWRSIRVEVDQPAVTARARRGYYAG